MEELRFELDCDTETAHFHREMEILYTLSGRLAVMTANTNFAMKPENFVVFNPYEYHTLYREKGAHTLSFYIPVSVLQYAGVQEIHCASCVNLEQEEYLQMLREKLALLFQGVRDGRNRLYLLSQLFSLLAILKQEFEIPEGTSRPMERDADNIARALRHMGQHGAPDCGFQRISRRDRAGNLPGCA